MSRQRSWGGELCTLRLISNDGTVLFDNDVADVSMLESHAGAPRVRSGGNRRREQRGPLFRNPARGHALSFGRLYNDDVLRFATTQSSVWGMMLHMLGPCAVVVVLALVSAAVGSRFLAQVISADLMRIDLDRPLESDAPVELSPLLTRLDAQRKRLEAQASERRQYTANVSHELKTPLTVISGYAEIIAAGIAKDEDVKSFAHTIHSESQRMRSMVDDIISLSKLDDMGKDSTSGDDLGVDMNQVVSLESLANDVCGRLRPMPRTMRCLSRARLSAAAMSLWSCAATRRFWARWCATWPRTRFATTSKAAARMLRLSVRPTDRPLCA